jgi:shikimate dehydrogenase
MVTKRTKPLKTMGVIGNPISHSLSPLMQNAALAQAGIPAVYMPFQVSPEGLEEFCVNAVKNRMVGFNVTVPHKQAILPHLHSVSREARLIGAVNTVLVKGKKLIGYNTDAMGYCASLAREAGFDVTGKQAILLGAGGAARAIAVALGLKRAREVIIINRTPKKAFDLASEFSKKFPKTIFSACALEALQTHDWPGMDLLVNATSMGMNAKKTYPLPLGQLPRHALVSDIVYNPLETPLLKAAKRHKLKTHAGWGMLLYQGALSFEIWTRKKAPLDVMKTALMEALKKR